MDALVFNMDRHTQNFGVLREQETGRIISTAPNFDNNMALISRGYVRNPEAVPNLLVSLFGELLEKRQIVYQAPRLKAEEITDIAEKIMPDADIDRKYVSQFVMANYQNLLRV